MSDVVIRAATPDEFDEMIQALADEFPERRIILGDLVGRGSTPSYNADANTKHLAQFVYPGELFSTPEGTAGLEDADTRLVATALMPAEYLDTARPDVFDYDDYAEYAQNIAGKFVDPVFFTGAWFPTSDYSVTGNPENSKPRKLGSMHFSESVFDTDSGCEPLYKIHMGLLGTVVVEADQLTDEMVEYAAGERDDLPVEEREDDSMDAQEVNDVFVGLSPGDKVRVNDRQRPLTVIPRSESDMLGIAGRECVFLTGNGTDYRVSVRDRHSRYPKLEWWTDDEYISDVEVVERDSDEAQEVAA